MFGVPRTLFQVEQTSLWMSPLSTTRRLSQLPIELLIAARPIRLHSTTSALELSLPPYTYIIAASLADVNLSPKIFFLSIGGYSSEWLWLPSVRLREDHSLL
jgi:hypothetical protein